MRKVVQCSMFDYQCSIINGPFLIINIYQLVIDDDGCSMQDTAEAERARRGGVDGLQTTLKTSDHWSSQSALIGMIDDHHNQHWPGWLLIIWSSHWEWWSAESRSSTFQTFPPLLISVDRDIHVNLSAWLVRPTGQMSPMAKRPIWPNRPKFTLSALVNISQYLWWISHNISGEYLATRICPRAVEPPTAYNWLTPDFL